MINYIIAGSSDSDETSKVTTPPLPPTPTLTPPLIARELLFNSEFNIPKHKSQIDNEAPKGLADLRHGDLQNLWFQGKVEPNLFHPGGHLDWQP